MSKHHSFEEKLKYMKFLDEGYPMRQLSRETKIVRSRLYIWRKRYIYYGEEGLRRKAPHNVSESEIASIKADLMGMADMGLKAKINRVKYRSYKGEIGRVAPNVIARDFKTTAINQKWATDITEYKIKGNCLNNSMMEIFLGLMKSELLYLQRWDTIDDFEAALDEYIKYYNNDRIKLRLDGKSPAQYRALQISNH